jgi:tetratricopeptide (TPR) repeat protein
MDYTAIGDTINLASRMQTMAKPNTILVSSEIYRNTRDFFKFSPLGKVKVKGKEIELDTYELLEAGVIKTRFEAAVVRGLSRFVGRQKEISALKEAFEMAQSGSGRVVGITGEAGVGKSRIILEFTKSLPFGDYVYFGSRCLHYGSPIAYVPILEIMKSYCDIKEGEHEFAIKRKMANRISQLDDRLRHILAPLHDLLSLRVEDEEYLKLEPVQKKERIFEAIRDLIIRESQNRPLVIAIDDLQWIDKTSEDLLNYLIGWLSNTRILLLLIYRLGYAHPWGIKSYYTRIHVEHLSAKTSTELLQSILHDTEIMPELRELIIGRAEGNPLFIEEFTHTLMETGYVQKRDHQYVLSTKISTIQVPDTIQGIITARIDRLGENLKLTMQLASVIGRDFAYRILNNVTGLQKELKSHLINLQELEFIYEKSLFPELEYVFKHTITQEVSYNSLLLKKRKEIHEKVGIAIEEIYSDRVEEFYEKLAYHYSQSDNWEKAYQYFRLSGDKSNRRYSTYEAFNLYKQARNALNNLPQTADNNRRGIEIRLLAAGPMKVLGYPEDSLEMLHEGERLSIELGDERSLATFYSSIGLCYSFRGDSIQGVEYGEKCFKQAEKLQELDLMAPIAFDLCSSYTIVGEYSKVIHIAPKVLALLQRAHRETDVFGEPFNFNLYSALSVYCGHAMSVLGNFKEGEALCEKGLRFALAMDNLYSIGFAEVMYGFIFLYRGDGAKAVEHAKMAISYGEKAQIVPMVSMAWGVLGWGYYLQGDWQTGLDTVENGIRIQLDSGIPFLLCIHYWVKGAIHYELGDVENARISIEEALKLAQDNHEKQYEGASKVLLGAILGRADISQCNQAEDCILQGIHILDELNSRPVAYLGHYFLGELYANTGQREKALETLKKAEGVFQEMGMDHWMRRTQSVLQRMQESTKG